MKNFFSFNFIPNAASFFVALGSLQMFSPYHALLTLNYLVIILVLVRCRHIRTLRQNLYNTRNSGSIRTLLFILSATFFFVSRCCCCWLFCLATTHFVRHSKMKRINYSTMTFQGCYFSIERVRFLVLRKNIRLFVVSW